MSSRGLALAVSVLFIVQIVTAAIGVSFVRSFVDGDSNRTALIMGASLMMFSGFMIALIGVLLYQVLKYTNNRLAVWVPLIRSIECVVALAFGTFLLTYSQPVPNHLLWVYILAGAAGVILSYLLFTSKLVPWPIATLGFIGYAFLLLGVPLGFAGIVDMNEGLGLALIVPGALFELIALPVWLIAKGFRPSPSAKASPSPVLVTAS